MRGKVAVYEFGAQHGGNERIRDFWSYFAYLCMPRDLVGEDLQAEAGAVRSPLSWVGGKHHQATWIISLFPPHGHYVEVCAGGLHVFFAKARSLLETVNDVNGDLVNFWLMCRDRAEELVRKLEWTPYSRGLFDTWRREPRPDDDLEWAARWFFMQCSRFSASHHGGWAYNRAKLTVTVPAAPQFRRRLARILAVRDRLADVQIECADFRVMIERYGGYEDNLLYIDPPYPGKGYYQHEFTEEDHRDLAALAHASKAKIALSSGDDPLTEELYGDWFRHEMECVTQSVKSDRGDSKPRRTELLLTNYSLQEDFFDYTGWRGGNDALSSR